MTKFRRTLALQVVFIGILSYGMSVHAQAMNGLWRSDGYGLLLEVQGKTIKAFEVTSISCIPAWQADGNATGANEITFIHDGCEHRLILDNSAESAPSCRLLQCRHPLSTSPGTAQRIRTVDGKHASE
jgi:hypothetical protein